MPPMALANPSQIMHSAPHSIPNSLETGPRPVRTERGGGRFGDARPFEVELFDLKSPADVGLVALERVVEPRADLRVLLLRGPPERRDEEDVRVAIF